MPHRYSTAFSHIVLAGTGIYCLVQVNDQAANLPHITFGLITANSLLGIWRWGNPGYGDEADRIYKFASYVQLLFSLPCITTTVWLSCGYDKQLSWSFTILPFIPLVCYLADGCLDKTIEEMINPINIIALGVVALMAENYWGVAVAVSYAIDHYMVLLGGESLESIPAQDLYNYGLCFFAYFALRAIGEYIKVF